MHMTSLLLVVCGTRKGRSKINEHYFIPLHTYALTDFTKYIYFFIIFPRYFSVKFNIPKYYY